MPSVAQIKNAAQVLPTLENKRLKFFEDTRAQIQRLRACHALAGAEERALEELLERMESYDEELDVMYPDDVE